MLEICQKRLVKLLLLMSLVVWYSSELDIVVVTVVIQIHIDLWKSQRQVSSMESQVYQEISTTSVEVSVSVGQTSLTERTLGKSLNDARRDAISGSGC